MKLNKQSNVLLSKTRDIPLLLFLWKWKVCSTAALVTKFFPDCKGKTAYNRLLTLRQAGLIQVRSDTVGQDFVCMLDKRGFNTIKNHIPHIKEDGYKSENPGHDLLVTAFQLGDWLLDNPEKVETFSEQELRRYSPDSYPNWVPKTDLHRPDGYSHIPCDDQMRTIAFEVELHYKRDSDYYTVSEFYEHFQNITRVLWLVPRTTMGIRLEEKFKKHLRSDVTPHCFVLFDDFKNLGWQAPFFLGPEQGKTIAEVMKGTVPVPAVKPTGAGLVRVLLDSRKSPHNTEIYRGFTVGDFTD